MVVETMDRTLGVPATATDYYRGPGSRFALGVDLGQSVDATAICVVERRCFGTDQVEMVPGVNPGATNPRRVLRVRYILKAAEMLPLRTDYHDVVAHIAMRREQVAQHGRCDVLFDESGARGAGDMLRAATRNPIACVFTSSEDDAHKGDNRWSISKANMVSKLLAALESGPLEIADGILDIEGLIRHLTDLRRKISALGHHSFNARTGQHDDYVSALGLAYWHAAQPPREIRAVKIVGI